MKLPKLLAFSGITALVLSISACASPPVRETISTPNDPVPITPNNRNNSSPSSPWYETPIVRKLVILGVNTAAIDPELRFQQQQCREELVAQCLRDAGFEYVPFVITNPADSLPHTRFDDRDWVTQWGFEINRNPRTDAEQMGAAVTDPNLEIRAGLGNAELDAYWNALAECRTDSELKAAEEIPIENNFSPEANAIYLSNEFQPLREAISRWGEQLLQDPAWTEINLEWSACLADAGYPWIEPRPAIWNTSRWAEIVRGMSADQEIEMALTELDCRQSLNIQTRLNQLTEDRQNQFIEDHRAEWDALRDAIEQGP